MKKLIFLGFISFIFITLFFGVTFLVDGTPWGKANAIKKAQEYLNITYTQEMIVRGIYYDIENNKYMISAYPKNNQEFKFYIYIDRKDGEVWKDDYYLRRFSYELGMGADEYTKKIFGEESRAYASLDGGTIDIYNISNLNESIKLEDVIDKFNQKYCINLHIPDKFINSENKIKKLYKFINYTNSLECKPYEIYFSYYRDNSDSSNFNLLLEEKEYHSITCAKDLLQYINKEISDQ